MPQVTQVITVKNPLGLHARPATAIAKLLQPTPSKVSFSCGHNTINAKSALCILMLGAAQYTPITVTIEGEDAGAVMASLQALFEHGFGEV